MASSGSYLIDKATAFLGAFDSPNSWNFEQMKKNVIRNHEAISATAARFLSYAVDHPLVALYGLTGSRGTITKFS